jgi:hypothetical protein
MAVVAALMAAPVGATDDTRQELREGMDLMGEAMRLMLRGLQGEIEPALRELEDALRDMHAYHPPEILPNGDIIIRRKVPKPVDPNAPGEDGEIDL